MNKTEKEWAVGMLIMGVILGIVGSLASNLLDRYFTRYGAVYDIAVALGFIFIFWLVDRKFTKLLYKSN